MAKREAGHERLLNKIIKQGLPLDRRALMIVLEEEERVLEEKRAAFFKEYLRKREGWFLI